MSINNLGNTNLNPPAAEGSHPEEPSIDQNQTGSVQRIIQEVGSRQLSGTGVTTRSSSRLLAQRAFTAISSQQLQAGEPSAVAASAAKCVGVAQPMSEEIMINNLRIWVALASPGEKRQEAMDRILGVYRRQATAQPITALDLSNLGLTTLPAEIGQLTTLLAISVSDNQLKTLPPEFWNLTALTTLMVANNQFEMLSKDIGQLVALKRLLLNNNHFKELPPEIGNLAALRVLHVNHNKLKALPAEFSNLTALTLLGLIDNELEELPKEIGQLVALKEIYLNKNHLSKLPPEIGKLPALTKLYVNNNLLEELPAEIGQLAALTDLRVNQNKLKALPAELGKLKALKWLGLDYNMIETFPSELGGLVALTELYLTASKIRSLPPEIGKLGALTQLYLDDNKIAALPPQFGELKALEFCSLNGNKLKELPPEIGQLTALKELGLNRNELNALPAQIGGLGALTKLRLDDNILLELTAAIGRLGALTELHLSGNYLAELPKEIGSLSALKKLHLEDNKLQKLPLEFGQLAALTELFIYNNPFTDRDSLQALVESTNPCIKAAVENALSFPAESVDDEDDMDVDDDEATIVMPAEIAHISGVWDPKKVSINYTTLDKEPWEILLEVLYETLINSDPKMLKFKVKFYDADKGYQPAMDAGGPSRELVTKLFSGIVKGHEDNPLKFEKGLPVLRAEGSENQIEEAGEQPRVKRLKMGPSEERGDQIKGYEVLGRLMGLCLQGKLITGCVFDSRLFQAIGALTANEIAQGFLSDNRYYELYTRCNLAEPSEIKSINFADRTSATEEDKNDAVDILMAREDMTGLYRVLRFKYPDLPIEIDDLSIEELANKIKGFLDGLGSSELPMDLTAVRLEAKRRIIKAAKNNGTIQALFPIAKGFKMSCDAIASQKWERVRAMAPGDLEKRVQGVFSIDLLKNMLSYDTVGGNVNPEDIVRVKGLVNDWLDGLPKDSQLAQDFVCFVTGSTALRNVGMKIYVKQLSDQYLPTASTCYDSFAVFPAYSQNVTPDQFKALMERALKEGMQYGFA